MLSLTDLDGKVALVTGASRGIGRAIAIALGQMGATVVGTATTDTGAEAISKTLEAEGLKGYGVSLNIADAINVTDVIAQITKDVGSPAVLVNNAGITRDNLLLRMKETEWDDVIQTNLTGLFHVTKTCLKGMVKARWGRIISVSSVVGTTGNPGQCNYAATKAGVMGFSKSLALEIASRGVTVNVVAPGMIDTDMTRQLTDDQKAAMLNNIPMGATGQPEDIANAVAFLASEQARYITGQTLHVNGGMYTS